MITVVLFTSLCYQTITGQYSFTSCTENMVHSSYTPRSRTLNVLDFRHSMSCSGHDIGLLYNTCKKALWLQSIQECETHKYNQEIASCIWGVWHKSHCKEFNAAIRLVYSSNYGIRERAGQGAPCDLCILCNKMLPTLLAFSAALKYSRICSILLWSTQSSRGGTCLFEWMVFNDPSTPIRAM